MAAANPKIGALAAKALNQAGIQEQKAPLDLSSRLDAPLDDLVKLNKKKPRTLIEKVRAKNGAKAKPKAPAAGQPALASKAGKKVIAKDAKQAVRNILAAPQKGAAKPKAPVARPAPRLVPAGKQVQKPSAQQKGERNITISLQNIRQNKLKKPAAQQRQQGGQQRVTLKVANQGNGGQQRRAIVVNASNQQRKDQRQQVAQQRRVGPSAPAAAGKGLTLSERWTVNKPKNQAGNNNGGRKVSQGRGGKQQGGTRFKINL